MWKDNMKEGFGIEAQKENGEIFIGEFRKGKKYKRMERKK